MARRAPRSTRARRTDRHPRRAQSAEAKDPTGCGDAYRAGLLYGLANELDWRTTGRIASLIGAIKIAEHGTQNHRFTIEQFHRRYRDAFGGDF